MKKLRLLQGATIVPDAAPPRVRRMRDRFQNAAPMRTRQEPQHEIELPADVLELIETNAQLAREVGLLGYVTDPVTLLRRVLHII